MLTSQGLAEEEDRDCPSQVYVMLWNRLKEPPVVCHGKAGAGWGSWRGSQVPVVGRVAKAECHASWTQGMLTQHKRPGSTPRPLSMNPLNHSTEKLTQTHRHPSNPQKVTERSTSGTEAAGHHHPYPSHGGLAAASPRGMAVPSNTGSSGPSWGWGELHFSCVPFSALCWQNFSQEEWLVSCLFFLDLFIQF